jgi:DNA-binding MarR family transcriptional regulator
MSKAVPMMADQRTRAVRAPLAHHRSVSPEDRTPTSPIPPDVVQIEQTLARISYLLNRARQHDHIAREAGVRVDRAAVPILRALADSAPQRPVDLAARLAVEGPHITRQVNRLEVAGYVKRVSDPDDGRAQLVSLTASGEEAVGRIVAVVRGSVWRALEQWPPRERKQLATMFARMVDDFLNDAAENGRGEPADVGSS